MKKETVDSTLAASQFTKEKNYWLKKLSGVQEISRFFYDSKNTLERPAKYAEMKFQFTGDVFIKLMQLSKGVDYTLHIILTAALVALLGKYTAAGDIVTGTPIYKQDIEGEFINTVLALRNFIEDNMTFKEMLMQVKQTIVEAVENQNYPMERLIHQLNMSSSDHDFPLFDIALMLESIHEKAYLRPVNPNVIFSFSNTGECIEGVVEYNSSLYEQATINRIVSHYMNLMEEVMFNVDLRLSEANILSYDEKQRLLVDFNGTKEQYPGAETVHEIFRVQVEKTPDRIAVKYKHTQLSYSELNRVSDRLANMLRKKGVNRDKVVGLMIDRSPEMITSILGILKAGGAYLPIGPEYPEDRVLSMLDDSNVSFLLTREKVLKGFSTIPTGDIKGWDAKVVTTPIRPQIKDFDNLPKPDRTLVNYEKYHKYIGIAMAKHTVSLQATRGCPYNCAFCHKIWPKSHVVRSAGNIMEEIRRCYDAGVKRFVFIDDIFNLDRKNSTGLLERIIKEGLDIQLFFPNGLRGDILTKDFIDLMMEAGTVNIDLSLESASPRIQKLIRKNLNLEKFKDSVDYITGKYPHLLLEMELMIGFPTETEEEAQMTLDFLNEFKWVHFPNLNILKIYPNTDMHRLAVENGIGEEVIKRSADLGYHEIPETLPFSKGFARRFQAKFVNEYFLSKERLTHVLHQQVKTLTENELVQKYDSYLPMKIKTFSDILESGGISREEFGEVEFLQDDVMSAPGFTGNIREYLPVKKEKARDALNVLLLDLSLLFTSESKDMLYDMIEEPLGLMYLLSYLDETFQDCIHGKIAKSRIDFDSFDELKKLIMDFNPDLIGIRTLSFYKNFFHKAVFFMRQWGVKVPIIAGGPYATSDYRSVLEDPNVDLVVLGEGERTFAELIEKIIANDKKPPHEEVLKDIRGIAFIRDKNKAPLKERRREIIPVDRVIEGSAPAAPLENINRPGDLVYVIYTSGSTGKPKGAMLEHRNLVNLLKYQSKHTNIDCSDVLQFTTISFDVSFQEIFSALFSGGTLHLIDKDTRNDISELFEVVRKNHIKTLFMPASFLKFIFSEEQYIEIIPGAVAHIVTAGEQVIVGESFRRYLKEKSVYFHNHYGPAETHVVTTLTLVPSDEIPELPSIGRPVSNTNIYILDTGGNLLPIGVPGELYISGTQVGRGYLERRKLTEERFIPSPFIEGDRLYRTGDLARWLPDGNIEFLGRIDYQVKIRGYRVEPGEIENRLLNHEDIQDAVVAAKETRSGEKYLCAYFVSDRELPVHQLREYLSKDLPDYMIPAVFMQLKEIPLTGSGKADRKALPEPEMKENERIIPPRNEVEKKVLELWAEVLGIEKVNISIDANFFDIGGHSLRATILLTKIHKEFNVKISLAELFASPRIDALSRYIEKATYSKYASIEPAEQKEYYALSSAQKRLYVVQQMDVTSTTYNLPAILLFDGPAYKERLEEIFKKLVNRHEIFRTSFKMMGERPVQRIHDQVEFSVVSHDTLPGQDESRLKQIIDGFIRPFDLSQAPLLRVEVLDIGKSKHILMIDMHHIITDGTSIEVFKRDVSQLYAGKELEFLRLQYKDFSCWQNELFESGQIKKQEDYWLEVYSNEIPKLNLPTDYPRPGVFNFKGDYYDFAFDRESVLQISEFCKNNDVTLYMCLLAVFIVLLFKYTGENDIIVGSSIAGRPHADLQEVLGMFVNMLAIRNFPEGHKTFKEFLNEIKTHTIEAFENQDVQFEELVDKLNLDRDISRNPLFDVSFGVLNYRKLKEVISSGEYRSEIEKLKFSDENLRFFEYEHMVSRFDLTFLLFFEEESNLYVFIEYYTGIFKKNTIERMVAHFKDILQAVVKAPSIKLKDIEMITAEEKKKILNEFNDTTSEYPQEKTIHRLFEEQALQTPDAIALNMSYRTHMTYIALNREAGLLASLLKEKGAAPGTMVGIMAGRSVEMITGILGILKANCAYVPLDPKAPAARTEYILDECGANLVSTTRGLSEKMASGKEIIYLDDHEERRVNPANVLKSAGKPGLAYVIFTSGSTGVPKGVPITHANLSPLLHWGYRHLGIDSTDRTIQNLSYYFDWSVWEIFITLTSGASLHIVPDEILLDSGAVLDHMLGKKITVLHITPTQYTYLAGTDRKAETLKYLFIGAEKLTYDLAKRSLELVDKGCRVFNMYGPTEATIIASVLEIDGTTIETFKGLSSIPIGRAIANVRFLVLNNYLNLCPVNVAGELHISGDGVARGYLNNPEQTAERFSRGAAPSNFLPPSPFPLPPLYRTGDLVRWLPDGNIEYLRRIDQQVKIRGYRIEPGEIENRLSTHDSVKEAVVIDREDSESDRYLCAYIVPVKEFDKLDTFALRQHLSNVLPDYMIPVHYIPLEKIPLTPNGKIDREALPAPSGNIRSMGDYAPPVNETEEKLVKIWEKVLGVEQPGATYSFFRVGGDSIKAIKLLHSINEELNANLKIPDLYLNETIERLAARINEDKQVQQDNKLQEAKEQIEALKSRIMAEGKLPGDIEDVFPMSEIEKGIVYHYSKNSEEGVYHVQAPYEIKYPGFNPETFKKAFALMVEKHLILRTSFNMADFEEPIHIVYRNVFPDIEHYDISQLEKSGQEKHIDEFLLEDRRKKFDISVPPLWRIRTFALGNDNICILVSIHHAIIDGWSFATLMTELHNTYLHLKSEPGFVPQKLKNTYKQFVIEEIAGKGDHSIENFWKKELDGCKRLDFFSLSSGIKGGVGQIGQMPEKSWYSFAPDDDLLPKLEKTAQHFNTTVKDLCLGAYFYMIGMLSYENDITVGLVTNVRPVYEDSDQIVGCFLNTVPVRMIIPHNIKWSEYIGLVHNKMLEVKMNDKMPLFEIAKLVGGRDENQNPLFDTFFNFVDFHVVDQDAFDSKHRVEQAIQIEGYSTTNMLLDFNVNITLREFEVEIYYHKMLISDELMKKLSEYFINVLNKFICEPGEPAKKDEVISVEERQTLLYEFNDTKSDYPGNKIVHGLFEEQVEKTSDYIAITGPMHGAGQGENLVGMRFIASVSYRELNKRANHLAHLLRKKGVGRDKVVGLMVERSPEMIIGILSVMKGSGAYLPIDTEYPEERKKFMLDDGGVKLLLTNDEIEPGQTGYISRDIEVINIGYGNKYTGDNRSLENINKESDLVYVIYTSGSTGKPKGVMQQHKNLVNLLMYQFEHTNIDFSQVLQFTTISFDVSFQEIFSTLLSGGTLHLIDKEIRNDMPELFKVIERSRINTLFLPASFLKFIFNEEQYARLLPGSVDHIVTAGEQLVVSDRLKRYLKKNNTYLHNHYGPAETHVVTTLTLDPREKIPELPFIGKPISNTHIYILDKEGHLQPIGVPGELYIGGSQVARGYISHRELTSERFIPSLYVEGDTLYRTGDLARWLPDGNIEFLGRVDFQVKIRGFRVEPEEIERRLLNIEGIKRAVVIAKEDKGGQKYLCAYFVSDRELTLSKLQNELAADLPDYMIPSFFVQLEEIPLTENGKIDRKALPDPEIQKSEEISTPRNELEMRLAELWSEVLDIDKGVIGIDSNFFRMGGHSLRVAILASKIQKEFNLRFPLVELFNIPTIRRLAEHIEGMKKEKFGIEDDNLVLLKEKENKDHHLFFIHDGTGEVEGYIEFCQRLNNGFNCWGIRADRLENSAPQDWTVEALAQKYIEKIKKVQPQGPYYIAGWSGGGIISFEIVKKLEQENEKIAFLGVIDAPAPQTGDWEAGEFNLESERAVIMDYLPDDQLYEKLKNVTELRQIWPIVTEYLETDNPHVETFKKTIARYGMEALPNYRQLDTRETIHYLNIGRTVHNMLALYSPQGKIHTPIHFFAAARSEWGTAEPWHDYCHQVIDTYEIPCDHYSVFKMPQVEGFAKQFDRILSG